MKNKYILIISTFKTQKEAQKISAKIIKEKKASCVNIIKNINSIFLWNNEINKNTETIIIIKTTTIKFKQIKQKIQKLHSYECPEIISIEIEKGNKKYLQWITNSLKKNKT